MQQRCMTYGKKKNRPFGRSEIIPVLTERDAQEPGLRTKKANGKREPGSERDLEARAKEDKS